MHIFPGTIVPMRIIYWTVEGTTALSGGLAVQNDDPRGKTPTDSTGSSAPNGPTTRRLSVGEIRRGSPRALFGTGAVLVLAAAGILYYGKGGNLFQTTKLNTSLSSLTQGPYSALFPIPTLSIRNIGEKPIAIQDISNKYRPECTTIPSNILTPYGAIDEKQFNTNLRHQMWIVYVVGASPHLSKEILLVAK